MTSAPLTCGCRGSATVDVRNTYNIQTGQDTVEVSGGVTINFGGATPKLSSSGPANSTVLIESVPANFAPDSAYAQTVTLIATTDTGYTSTITLPTEQVPTTAASANPGDSVYAWSVASASATDLAAWQQNVASHTNSDLQLSSVSRLRFTGNGAAGDYSMTTTINDPNFGSTAPATTTVTVSDGEPIRICPPRQICSGI